MAGMSFVKAKRRDRFNTARRWLMSTAIRTLVGYRRINAYGRVLVLPVEFAYLTDRANLRRKLDSVVVTGVKPGSQFGPLIPLGLGNRKHLFVASVRAICRKTDDDPLEVSAIGVINANDGVIVTRVAQHEYILAGRQDGILDLQWPIDRDTSRLVDVIGSQGGHEVQANQAQRGCRHSKSVH